MGNKSNNTLVIVESPAKAKTISKFLGKGYKVEATMGHVIDLPKSKLGINIDKGFEPRYITIRGKGKVLKKLRKEVKKSKDVLLATDPDREGEAISWHLTRALKIDEDKPRIEFNEITKSAIKNALKNRRPIDKNLVNSQQARRLLDRLVGYKLSPLLWKKVRRGLSAGRVQTVAVKLLCNREKEIESFEPEEYWTISASFNKKDKDFIADLYRISGKKFKINNEKEAKQILEDLNKSKFVVSDIKEKTRKRNPNPPFTTSTLQQRASSILGFSAKKTMYLAQQLYEGIDMGSEGTTGLISYIRTDSTRISREAQKQALDYIKEAFGDKYIPDKVKVYKAKEGSQDAHEAIRPTSVDRTPGKVKKYLNKDQYRLYKLIWERFVASQMSPAQYKQVKVLIKAGDKYIFRAKGSRIIFPGFLRVNTSSQKKDIILPPVKKSERLDVKEIKPEQHFTQPPPRYTEATLVKTLEEEGIGRPSTYAPIISTIISRGYVERQGKQLKPTELGFIVTDLLSKYFPDVTDIEFTAHMEERLDKIEDGKDEWRNVLEDFYSNFSRRLKEASEEMEEVKLEDEVTDEVCEKCGRNMVIKYGRYGKFLACSGYPECKNTKPYVIKTGVKCPQCKEGELVQRKSRKGRTFYGCSSYPDCKFVVWNKPVKEKCPECGGLMVEKNSKKQGRYYLCINKECGYKKEV
ncbi:type I DNA topoisomerase [Halothermothrix orenii]|uniref:DNA topoisomerase 1 n=1 Tax=Halothermothrix orenii (strain H 168 / OCM 544 / DSM 9562) TaxID=373903 RepID=B8CW42_HALOH|nr:type I DNA topoisomerase [Halothermothrix orenii]ACL69511.1 DNA topoisomerase I [Halothermothrix orenii H 168]